MNNDNNNDNNNNNNDDKDMEIFLELHSDQQPQQGFTQKSCEFTAAAAGRTRPVTGIPNPGEFVTVKHG